MQECGVVGARTLSDDAVTACNIRGKLFQGAGAPAVFAMNQDGCKIKLETTALPHLGALDGPSSPTVSSPRTPKRQLKVVPPIGIAYSTRTEGTLNCCVMTANLGSAGEDPTLEVLHHFLRDVREVLQYHCVHVFCLHLQEIGGKRYDEEFSSTLTGLIPTVMPRLGWSSGLMWHGRDDADFTAVGAVIFVEASAVPHVHLLDFTTRAYTPVASLPTALEEGRHYGCKKFRDAGTSRKGWVRYGLRYGKESALLVALHLYHDSDNRVSMESSVHGEGPYAERRRLALREVLDDVTAAREGAGDGGLMLGGDFNVRMDAQALVDWVKSQKEAATPSVKKNEISWGVANEEINHLFGQHWQEFRSNCNEVKVIQREMQDEAQVDLQELPVCWPPTYPIKDIFSSSVLESDTTHDFVNEEYSQKRLPAWTDRILFTPSPGQAHLSYHCMSSPLDHKLVFLLWQCAS